MKKNKIVLTLLLVSLQFGCATSKFHLGYHHTENRGEMMMRVSQEVVGESKSFEDQCVSAFIKYDISLIKHLFASKLTAKMTNEEVEKVNSKMRGRYKFSGVVKQALLGNKAPNTIPYSGDNYEKFDYIESGYMLQGSPGAMIKLQTTKVSGTLKLSGFVLISEPSDPNSDKKALNYFFSETEDKVKTAHFNQVLELGTIQLKRSRTFKRRLVESGSDFIIDTL